MVWPWHDLVRRRCTWATPAAAARPTWTTSSPTGSAPPRLALLLGRPRLGCCEAAGRVEAARAVAASAAAVDHPGDRLFAGRVAGGGPAPVNVRSSACLHHRVAGGRPARVTRKTRQGSAARRPSVDRGRQAAKQGGGKGVAEQMRRRRKRGGGKGGYGGRTRGSSPRFWAGPPVSLRRARRSGRTAGWYGAGRGSA